MKNKSIKLLKVFFIILVLVICIYLTVEIVFNFMVSTEVLGNCCSCKGNMAMYDVCCDCKETLNFFEKLTYIIN